jgi:hypothetical protein
MRRGHFFFARISTEFNHESGIVFDWTIDLHLIRGAFTRMFTAARTE